MNMREGWLCPRCGGAHSPDVATCPVNAAPSPDRPNAPVPVVPIVQPPFYFRPDCGCPNNNICMNVACPRASHWVTCSKVPGCAAAAPQVTVTLM